MGTDAVKKDFGTLVDVTFVFTDLEGSTAMSLAGADAYRQAGPGGLCSPRRVLQCILGPCLLS